MLRAGRSHNFIAECEQTGPDGKLYGLDDQWNAASFGFNYAATQVGGAQKCPEYAQTRLQFAPPYRIVSGCQAQVRRHAGGEK